MNSKDMTANSDCVARSGGAMVAGVMLQVAMLRNPGAMIRSLHLSD